MGFFDLFKKKDNEVKENKAAIKKEAEPQVSTLEMLNKLLESMENKPREEMIFLVGKQINSLKKDVYGNLEKLQGDQKIDKFILYSGAEESFLNLLKIFIVQKQKITAIEHILISFIKKHVDGSLNLNDFSHKLSLIIMQIEANQKKISDQINDVIDIETKIIDSEMESNLKALAKSKNTPHSEIMPCDCGACNQKETNPSSVLASTTTNPIDAKSEKEKVKIKMAKTLVINDKIMAQLYHFYSTLIQWNKNKHSDSKNSKKALRELDKLKSLTKALIELESEIKEDYNTDGIEEKSEAETMEKFLTLRDEITKIVSDSKTNEVFLSLSQNPNNTESFNETIKIYAAQKHELKQKYQSIKANLDSVTTGEFTLSSFDSSVLSISQSIEEMTATIEAKISLYTIIDNQYLNQRILDFKELLENDSELKEILSFKEKIEEEIKDITEENKVMLESLSLLNQSMLSWRSKKEVNGEALKREVDAIRSMIEAIVNENLISKNKKGENT